MFPTMQYGILVLDQGDPELVWGGGEFDSFYCLFDVRRFLAQLFAIGNITFWAPLPPGSASVCYRYCFEEMMNVLNVALMFLYEAPRENWTIFRLASVEMKGNTPRLESSESAF